MATPTTATPTITTAELTSAGTTVIADSVIAKVVGIATREVPGVFALGGGAARALGAIRDAINSTDLTQGISVEVGEKQVAVDVSIVAEYPTPLGALADAVRATIYETVEKLVGMDVAEVNVTINDVHIPSDDAVVAPETEAGRVL